MSALLKMINDLKTAGKELSKSGGGIGTSIPSFNIEHHTGELTLELSRTLNLTEGFNQKSRSLFGRETYDFEKGIFECGAETVRYLSDSVKTAKTSTDVVKVYPFWNQNGIELYMDRLEDPIYAETFSQAQKKTIEDLLNSNQEYMKYGDAKLGIKGYFNFDGIHDYIAPAGTGGSTYLEDKTIQECIDDFNACKTILKSQPGIYPNVIYIDADLEMVLENKQEIVSTGVTISAMQKIKQLYSSYKFVSLNSLKDDNGKQTFAMADNNIENMAWVNINPTKTVIDEKNTDREIRRVIKYHNSKRTVPEMKRPHAMIIAQGVSDIDAADTFNRK